MRPLPSARQAFRVLPLALALMLFGCGGPFGLFAGGALSGEVAPVPGDWSEVGASGIGQLETAPDQPYSVNLAYTQIDGVLYINAGDSETRWVRNIEADPRVRLRLRGVLYELRAEGVSDPEEIARFGEAWTSQSFFRRDPARLEQVWIYRLQRR